MKTLLALAILLLSIGQCPSALAASECSADDGKTVSLIADAAVPAAKNSVTVSGGEAAAISKQPKFSGNVSWYGEPFHGRKTASGQIFDMNKLTAAHKVLPFYTRVLVENPKTGKTVIVSVTDRGPFVRTRVMDLSREAARRLGTLLGGIAWVDCVVVGSGSAADIK